jgi:hypothetical protein
MFSPPNLYVLIIGFVAGVSKALLWVGHFAQFPFHYRVQNGSGAYPASYPMGTRGSFPGVKPQGREADHSPPSSAELKECVKTYTPPIRLHDVVLS